MINLKNDFVDKQTESEWNFEGIAINGTQKKPA
jgi:hypothetical protein